MPARAFSSGSRRLALFQMRTFEFLRRTRFRQELTATHASMQIQKAAPVRFMKGLRYLTTTSGKAGGAGHHVPMVERKLEPARQPVEEQRERYRQAAGRPPPTG